MTQMNANIFSLSLSSLEWSTEGIYRISGNKAEMESMQRQFDQGVLLFLLTALEHT